MVMYSNCKEEIGGKRKYFGLQIKTIVLSSTLSSGQVSIVFFNQVNYVIMWSLRQAAGESKLKLSGWNEIYSWNSGFNMLCKKHLIIGGPMAQQNR